MVCKPNVYIVKITLMWTFYSGHFFCPTVRDLFNNHPKTSIIRAHPTVTVPPHLNWVTFYRFPIIIGQEAVPHARGGQAWGRELGKHRGILYRGIASFTLSMVIPWHGMTSSSKFSISCLGKVETFSMGVANKLVSHAY